MRRQTKELEFEMMGRRQRRILKETSHGNDSTTGHTRGSSHQGHSRLSKDRSNESRGRSSLSSKRERCGHPSAALDVLSRVLRRAARSSFYKEIERTEMPRHFTHPPFTCYDGKTDLVKHVSHFTQMMVFCVKCSLSALGPRQ